MSIHDSIMCQNKVEGENENIASTSPTKIIPPPLFISSWFGLWLLLLFFGKTQLWLRAHVLVKTCRNYEILVCTELNSTRMNFVWQTVQDKYLSREPIYLKLITIASQ